jgi:hypothetical protein
MPDSSEPSMMLEAGEARDLVMPHLNGLLLEWMRSSKQHLAEAAIRKEHPRPEHEWASLCPEPEERWLEFMHKDPGLLVDAASTFVHAGRFLMNRAIKTMTEERHEFFAGERQNARVTEVRGKSSWISGSIRDLCQGVVSYTDPAIFPRLEASWPRDLDLGSLWMVGVSDLNGDQLLVLQGSRLQVLGVLKGWGPAWTVGGRESLIMANSLCQRLTPQEAACLVPGALDAAALLWIE